MTFDEIRKNRDDFKTEHGFSCPICARECTVKSFLQHVHRKHFGGFSVNGVSNGGLVTAKKLRADAIAKYMLNPNTCKRCGCVIPIGEGQKVSQVRQKRFCSRSCSASHNNKNHKPRIKRQKFCKTCGNQVEDTRKNLCSKCRLDRLNFLNARTRALLTHPEIRGHARIVAKGFHMSCSVCGYDKHVEICHRRPVRDFPDDATISDINAIDNLIVLCPNHHWEFDAGLLTI